MATLDTFMRQHYRFQFVYLVLIALLFCIQFSANSEAQDTIPEATEPIAEATEVTAVPSEAASEVPTQEITPVPTEPEISTEAVEITPVPGEEVTVSVEPEITDIVQPTEPIVTVVPTDVATAQPSAPTLLNAGETLLYYTNFEDATASEWSLSGDWQRFNLDGDTVLRGGPASGEARLLEPPLTSGAAETHFRILRGALSLNLRQSETQNYAVEIHSDGLVNVYENGILLATQLVDLDDIAGSHTLRVYAVEQTLLVQINGVSVLSLIVMQPFTPSQVVLTISEGSYAVDDVALLTTTVADFDALLAAQPPVLPTLPDDILVITPEVTEPVEITPEVTPETAAMEAGQAPLPPRRRDADDETVGALYACNPNDTMTRISRTYTGAEVNGSSRNAAASYWADFVVFESTVDLDGVNDGLNVSNIYIYNYDYGFDDCYVYRASRTYNNYTTNGASTDADISDDGRYVVYRSTATNIVPGDTNNQPDIFLYDTWYNTTKRISVSSTGVQANNLNYPEIMISGDGNYVVYASAASNLVSGDNNNRTDIFLYNIVNGTTRRVSFNVDGTQHTGDSLYPAISYWGDVITYSSHDGTRFQVYTYAIDLFTGIGVTEQITFGYNGSTANGNSLYASVSENGRYIAYESVATNLVSGDTNAQVDIFLYDRAYLTTTRISESTTGTQGNGSSSLPHAGDRWILFSSPATNLVVGDTDTNGVLDVFLYDIKTDKLTRVTSNLTSDKWTYVSLTSDGTHIIFDSPQSNLVGAGVDTNGIHDVFSRYTNPPVPMPLEPINLTVNNTTGNTITFNWTDNSADETGFKIYQWQGINGVWDFYEIADVPANTTTYSDLGLDCNSYYYYTVTSYNSSGESWHGLDPASYYLEGITGACPGNDEFASAYTISSLSYTNSQSIAGATMNYNSDPFASCSGNGHNNSVWYKYTPPVNQSLHIDTVGSDYDTMLYVLTGTLGDLTLLMCNDDAEVGVILTSSVAFDATAGTTYYIMVTNWGSDPQPAAATLVLNVEAVTPMATPSLLTPGNGLSTQNTMPYFSWSTVVDAVAYRFQLDNDADFSTPNYDLTQTATDFTPSALADGLYYWRVQAINGINLVSPWSLQTVEVDNIAPDIPDLTAPADNGITSLAQPTFTWTAEIDTYEYQIEIATDAGFTSIVSSASPTSASFNSAILAQGTYYWHVRVVDAALNFSSWSSTRILTVNYQLTPNEGVTLITAQPTFTWATHPAATEYQLEVDDNADFSSPILSDSTTNASYTPLSALPYATLYWRLNVDTGSGWIVSPFSRSLVLRPPVPGVVTLSSPAHLAYTNDNTPDLSWVALTGAGITYEIQVDNQAAFTSPEFSSIESAAAVTVTPLASNGVYYWRVRGRNAWDEVGMWSSVRSFTLDTVPVPGTLALSAPANVATVTSARPPLSWLALAGSSKYEIELDDNADFSSPIVDTVVATLSYVPTQSLPQGTYYWRVCGQDLALNCSSWSNREFTVNIQTAPANNASVFTLRPTFTWALVPGATQYQVQVANDSGFTDIEYISPTIAGTVASHLVPLPSPLTQYGTYYWRVNVNRGAAFGNVLEASQVYRTVTLSPAAPTAVTTTPTAAVMNDTTPDLTWTALGNMVAGATFSYEVQVDNTSTFTMPLNFTDTVTSGTTTTVNPALPDGLYYWRVRGKYFSNVYGAWSVVRSFRVDTTAPNPPALTLPAVNAAVSSSRPTFTWAAQSGATQYIFRLATNFSATTPLAGNILFDTIVTTTSLTSSVNIPQGEYWWTVRSLDASGNESAFGEKRRVVINISTAPANAAILNTQRPTLTWALVPGATNYNIEIATDSSFTAFAPGYSGLVVGNVSSHAVPTNLDYGTYFWRVTPVGFGTLPMSLSRSFTLSPAAPVAPILALPLTGKTFYDEAPELSWNAVNNPAAGLGISLTYEVQVDNTATFTIPLEFEATGVSGTSVPILAGLTDGLYYWRVRAKNNLNVAGAWSAARTFRVTSSAPTLNLPADNATLIASRPTFSWTAVTGATGYQLQIATDSGFTSIHAASPVSPITTTSFVPTTSLAQGTYYWRVAWRDATTTTFSAYSIPRTVTINIQTTPANNAFVYSLRPTFAWALVPGATQYQVEVATDSAFTDLVAYTSPILAGTIASHVPPSNLPAYGTYYWRVNVNRGAAFGNVIETSPFYRTVTLSPVAPPAPILALPLTGKTFYDEAPGLSWNAVNNPAAGLGITISYEVQVDNTATFTIPLDFEDTAVSGTNVAIPAALVDGLYYWRVRAKNSLNVVGAWSASRTFRVTSSTPTLNLPADNATLTASRPTFSWVAVTGATGYRLQIDTDSGFSSPSLLEFTPTTASYALLTSLKQGTYYWRVAWRDATTTTYSAYSTPRTVTINIQTAPANNLTTTALKPTFAWAAWTGATQYRLLVDNDADFLTPVIDVTKATLSHIPTANLPYGQLYWRVDVYFNSAWVESPHNRSLLVSPTAAAAVTLLTPNAGSVTVNTTPELSWNPVITPGVTYTYEVQVDSSSTFTTPLNFTETDNDTIATVSPALVSGTYYWRVRAINNFNVVGAWSVVRTFIVDITPFGVPTLSAPVNGAALVSQSPMFTWVAITGATYEIQLDSVNPPSHTYTATTASFTPPGVLLPTTYYWRVRSKDAVGNVSAWSSTYTLNLTSPTNVAPPLNSYPTVTPTLTWSPISWADEYEIQVDDHSTFASVNYTTTTVSNSVDLDALSEGTYYWRVRARVAAENWGAWSSTGTFLVEQ
jgi:hypothetical protein